MKEKGLLSDKQQLRARAEKLTVSVDKRNIAQMSADDVALLLHDLETYQIELEMQNEDLRTAQIELKEMHDEYAGLYDFAPIGYITLSKKGLILQSNLTFTKMLGVFRSKLINKPLSAFINKEDQDILYKNLKRVVDTQGKHSCELRLRTCIDINSSMWVSLDFVSGVTPDNSCDQIRLIIKDISKRKKTEEKLRANEKKYRTLFENMAQGVFYQNADGILVDCNSAAIELFGLTADQFLGKSSSDPDWRVIREDGTVFPAEEHPSMEALRTGKPVKNVIVGLFNPQRKGFVWLIINATPQFKEGEEKPYQVFVTLQDITERKQAEHKLSYQAKHDALTGLINRYEFERRANRLIEDVRVNSSEHALCFMDLDQFKVINDTSGHIAGDELLRQLGRILHQSVRNRDTLVRLGGDEFAVLMEHCNLVQAKRVAQTILKNVNAFQMNWNGRIHRVGISIGLVQVTQQLTADSSELMKQADTACYMAKELGRNRIHVYHHKDAALVQRRGEMQWVSRINQALELDRFLLYAQPIEQLDDSPGIHFELLLRMQDETGAIITPGAFLPAAERYNLFELLDSWVIQRAFKLLSDNKNFLKKVDFISINLSGPSLSNPGFLEFIARQFNLTDISSSKICFEITETIAISNLEVATTFIQKFGELGCRFALDDFGSGLSSFGYLKNLPVDYLKIDGIFVRDIVNDPIDYAMVKSINEIAHVMGKKTIAEFVESTEIKDMLKSIGVDYVQGYRIGKPLLFEEYLLKYKYTR